MLYSSEEIIETMLQSAGLHAGDVLYDLGCGDGRVLIAALKKGAERAIGIDTSSSALASARQNAIEAGVSERVDLIRGDFFHTNLADATVVYIYAIEALNLKEVLLTQLKPGTRVVSHGFGIGDWKPDKLIHVSKRSVYTWIVPAAIEDVVCWDPSDSRGIDYSWSTFDEAQVRFLSPESGDTVDSGESADTPRNLKFGAVLANQTSRAIIALAVEWAFYDGMRDGIGRCSSLSGIYTTQDAPLPLRIGEEQRLWAGFPGHSRRFLAPSRAMEFCTSRSRDPLWKRGRVCLDAVFFDDGTFSGSNRLLLFDRTLARRYVLTEVANVMVAHGTDEPPEVIASRVADYLAYPSEVDGSSADPLASAYQTILHWYERERKVSGAEVVNRQILDWFQTDGRPKC